MGTFLLDGDINMSHGRYTPFKVIANGLTPPPPKKMKKNPNNIFFKISLPKLIMTGALFKKEINMGWSYKGPPTILNAYVNYFFQKQ